MTKYPVLRQAWREYERGWGNRPDGFTLHANRADRDAYMREYRARNHTKEEAPDEYSTMDGEPVIIDVDQELYDIIKASRNGIWETEAVVRDMRNRELERSA